MGERRFAATSINALARGLRVGTRGACGCGATEVTSLGPKVDVGCGFRFVVVLGRRLVVSFPGGFGRRPSLATF